MRLLGTHCTHFVQCVHTQTPCTHWGGTYPVELIDLTHDAVLDVEEPHLEAFVLEAVDSKEGAHRNTCTKDTSGFTAWRCPGGCRMRWQPQQQNEPALPLAFAPAWSCSEALRVLQLPFHPHLLAPET